MTHALKRISPFSESAARILADCGIEAKSVSVAFDSDLHPFAEAYICREKKIPSLTWRR